jgi:hypothetical protein|tara:strand:+ start:175 stop:501 length:327 start_codon:yes stop_codon:yes gene_type:complete
MAIIRDWTANIVASRWVDDTNAETPGRGNYFCAIECITATTFTALISEKIDDDSDGEAADVSVYINTEGTDAGTAIVTGDTFPVGTILYGKWTSFTLNSGSVVAYECK